MNSLEKVSQYRCFGGLQQRYRHFSTVLNCPMHFSLYLPPAYPVADPGPVPVATPRFPLLYWLSGLTCDDQNFVIKAGAQRTAAELNMLIVSPDTSPRGEDVADDPGYDLGQGAGFYVNATKAPWQANYQMYDYLTVELPELLHKHFHIRDKAAIAGHSMGGHGALCLALSNARQFCSVSAFAPIVNPCECDWGRKAFTHYLGSNDSDWLDYDSCALLTRQGPFLQLPMLIDQGLDDEFLDSQQLTRPLQKVAEEMHYPAQFRYHQGYDHSYFFIASFIEDHLRFHAKYLA